MIVTIPYVWRNTHVEKMDDYKNLYTSRAALKKALVSYWEIDRLSTSESRDSSDYISIIIDLNTALKSIPTKHRKVLFLNAVMGYSAQDISQIMNMPRSSVIDMVQLALEGVQSFLDLLPLSPYFP